MSPDNSSKYKKTVASMKEHIFNNYNEFDKGIYSCGMDLVCIPARIANSRIRFIVLT